MNNVNICIGLNHRVPYYDKDKSMLCPATSITSFCLNYFHLLARKPNIEKNSIYSNKFFHNFHLSESSFTCPRIRASGLAQRLHIYSKGFPIPKHGLIWPNISKYFCENKINLHILQRLENVLFLEMAAISADSILN